MAAAAEDRTTLIADVGGTNVRFGIVPKAAASPVAVREFRCSRFPGLTAAARFYLTSESIPWPDIALIAVAGPVAAGTFTLTNNGWCIDRDAIRQALGLQALDIVNDFAAQAMAIPALDGAAFRPLGTGRRTEDGPCAVIGPGTGLGVASLVRCGGRWHAIQGEGGHVTYSPVTDREMAVAAAVRDHHGHCSAERLLSGPGLVVIYRTLALLEDRVPDEVTNPAVIVQRAADAADPLATEAVGLFLNGLATTAGNLALTLGASGGVYLCGGILPKLGTLLDGGAFRARFEAKGRFRDYLRAIPTHLVIAEHAALTGMAYMLRQRAGQAPG